MNSEELLQVLARHEEKLAALITEMDKLYQEIQREMPGQAANWMDKEIERRIGKNHEYVQSLGIDKLVRLKSELRDLKGTLPRLVEEEFRDQTKWPHRRAYEDWSKFFRSADYIEPHLHEAYRSVVSSLGSTLDEFGLLGKVDQHSAWKSLGDGRFRYAYNTEYGGDQSPHQKEYFRSFDEFANLSKTIQSNRKQISEAKAKQMWRSAGE